MKIVRINPDTWDDAAALYAERIDARSHGRGRSDYPDPASALALMRLEYDNFAARFYGANADGYLAMDEDEWPDHAMQWFLKLGALANSSAFAQGYDRYPTATSVLRLLRSKMDDYGYDNIDRFGFDGLLVRLHDKIARLENLSQRESTANNETVEDTYVDIIGYTIIGAMVVNQQWRLPLKSNHPSIA